MTEMLKAERLEIKPFSEEDAQALAELFTDENIKKTYLLPDFDTPEALCKMTDYFTKLSHMENRFVRGICLDGSLIGFVNEVAVKDGSIEMGYVIHPRHWNKGYATEMLGEVIRDLFRWGYTKVRAGAFEENTASLRVLEKCGMTKCPDTEIISYRGAEHKCIYYEITP